MGNTKPIGVAYADPDLDSAAVSGAVTAASVTASGAVAGASVTATGTVSGATVTSTGDLYIKSATVAAAGANQGNAAAVAGGFTLVSGADDTKGVRLPAAVAGRVVIIKNNTSAKTLKIYPATDDAINAVAANGSYDIDGLTSTLLVAYDATTWYSVPLVAS